MNITIPTPDVYAELVSIQSTYPQFTFQNVGYEYIKDILLAHKDQVKRIEEILKSCVSGFVEFNNFRINDNKILIRFQYHWTGNYVGVGYLPLDDLNPKEK